jgi:hypothetical protein
MMVYFVGLDLMREIDRLKWILGAGRGGEEEREAGERKRPSTSAYTSVHGRRLMSEREREDKADERGGQEIIRFT